MGFWHIAHYACLEAESILELLVQFNVDLVPLETQKNNWSPWRYLFWCTTVCRAEMCCASLCILNLFCI